MGRYPDGRVTDGAARLSVSRSLLKQSSFSAAKLNLGSCSNHFFFWGKSCLV